MARTTKSRGRRTQIKKLAPKSGKLSEKDMKKAKGALSGQNTYTGETPKNILLVGTYGRGS